MDAVPFRYALSFALLLAACSQGAQVDQPEGTFRARSPTTPGPLTTAVSTASASRR